MTNFLKMMDLSGEEIVALLDLADQLKYEQKHEIPHRHLEGKTLGMIFAKSSTRTRVSFEVGMVQLGGYPMFLSTETLQLGRGEPISDTAKVLSRYLDGIMIRTFAQAEVEELAEHSSIPIINGLTDEAHPCQVLADLMTIREYLGTLSGLKLCYVGDGNNMANSLVVGCLKVGMKVSLAVPKGYEPCKEILEFASAYGDSFHITDSPKDAAKDADVLYTDVWASMGQEEQSAQRKKAFSGYQINEELVRLAKEKAMVLHCLPAYREQEISAETMKKHEGEIFDQAENRLHAQKAILVTLLKPKEISSTGE